LVEKFNGPDRYILAKKLFRDSLSGFPVLQPAATPVCPISLFPRAVDPFKGKHMGVKAPEKWRGISSQ